MALSMTGFGKGEASGGGRSFVVEIKSVNHRFCDISVKMPRAFSSLEERIRQAVANRVSRGKIDVFVSYAESGERERAVSVDIGLARAYIESAETLKSRFDVNGELNLATLIRMPDLFRIDEAVPDEDEIWELLAPATDAALVKLTAMRAREGSKLISDVSEKLEALKSLLAQAESRAPLVVDDYRTRLNARLAELLGTNIPDENRVAAEIAMYADKCCIDEEITRFKSHLAQAGACCGTGGPVGRKLDFILQEINREINTIGSKANDLYINERVVEMKSEAEKIREQIQNLE